MLFQSHIVTSPDIRPYMHIFKRICTNCLFRYKNNIELEGSGTGGVLTLVNLSKDDAGQYKCSSETEAGVSQTPEALLVVKGTCVPH